MTRQLYRLTTPTFGFTISTLNDVVIMLGVLNSEEGVDVLDS